MSEVDVSEDAVASRVQFLRDTSVWFNRMAGETAEDSEFWANANNADNVDKCAAVILELRRQLTAEKARADEAEAELEEEQRAWPQWATEIRALLERFGQDYSYVDEINLPNDLEEWMEGCEADWQRKTADLQAKLATARDDALEEAAKVVEQHDKSGREWVPESFWGTLSREASARIRALKSTLPATSALDIHPIATAPTDGTRILLLTGDFGWVEGWWDAEEPGFYRSDPFSLTYDPDNLMGEWVSDWQIGNPGDVFDADRRLACGSMPHFWAPLPAVIARDDDGDITGWRR